LMKMSTTDLPGEVQTFFPYSSVRPYQSDFIKVIYEGASSGISVCCDAPNGLGKTIGVLSATLPIAREHGLSILYATRTHKQADRVIEELRAISPKVKVTGVSLRGRLEMCLHPMILGRISDPKGAMDVCGQLRELGKCQYFGNLTANSERSLKLQEYLKSEPIMASEVSELCRKEKLCPYELAKLILNDVDVIALSYIYLFEPNVRGSFFRYFARSMSDAIIVLDEAHNLPDFAAGLASDQLSLSSIQQAEQELRKHGYPESAVLCRALKTIIQRIVEQVEEELSVPPNILLRTLRSELGREDLLALFVEMYAVGESIRRRLLSAGKYPRSYAHRVSEFMLKWLETADDQAFTHIISKPASADHASSRLEVVALDPRRICEPVLRTAYCTISVSGTLMPIDAYIKVVGLPRKTGRCSLPSPFPEDHILTLVCIGVTTSMEKRNPEMYRKMVRRVSEVVQFTPANVGVFVVSYDVLQGLLEAGLKEAIDKPLFCEEQFMPSRKNDQLLSEFRSHAEAGGAVLLGVQGGRNSEGEDYPGNEMNSVVVVGVPYARPLPRIDAQVRYYERRFPGHGHEYGYIIPALKKASQATGRPIRTLEDRGAIILLDYRFSTAFCRKYLPAWVNRNMKVLPDEDGTIAGELTAFFKPFDGT